MLPQRIGIAAGLAVLLITGCQDTLPVSPDASTGFGPPVGATFDWSMPARFGADQDGDGQTDYLRLPEQISPAAWRVDFDACSSAPETGRPTYRWFVDGKPVAAVEACMWSHEFPAEGAYQVRLQIVPRGGRVVWAEQRVTVQDFLVISFGDSYASGEGVPEVPGANDALISSLESTLAALDAARANLNTAQEKLAEALEAKGLWESVLQTNQNRLNAFLAACTDIDGWSDVVACASFLAGLPFDTFQSALNHFTQLRNNALERLNDAIAAVAAAQAAFSAAQTALQNLESALAQVQAGLNEAEWQAPYAGENWGDDNCHRSANAAPARAARALEDADPRTSVTFVHLACTGAQIDRDRAQLDQQTQWAAALVGTREVDAVLISIGGNDAGFADIAVACTVQQECFSSPSLDPNSLPVTTLCNMLGLISADFGTQCTNLFAQGFSESAADIVSNGVTALPAEYAKVAGLMLPRLAGLPSQNRVYISEYVDMTRDDQQAYCETSASNLLGAMPGITIPEMQWLDVIAATSINQAVASAAGTHGWNLVTGIHSAYRNHGYCANDHWVVRLHESLLMQGDPGGIAHPNNAGHAHNGSRILAALLADLYPGGIAAGPRPPN